jgi:hypothetical protein
MMVATASNIELHSCDGTIELATRQRVGGSDLREILIQSSNMAKQQMTKAVVPELPLPFDGVPRLKEINRRRFARAPRAAQASH